jgi:SAM-dependent methyltransferase
VTGLDIAHDIGAEFAHPGVQYVRDSIEASRLKSNSYEIIYCVATMEHVGRIEAGFLEMVRLARPGGTIFSVAAPLWHSRRGHHIPCFDAWPWIHLLMNAGELAAFAEHRGLAHNGMQMRNVVEFLGSDAFNHAPAARYVEACQELPVSEVLRNDLWMDGEEDLTLNLFSRLKAKGFAREELLAASHTLVCRK